MAPVPSGWDVHTHVSVLLGRAVEHVIKPRDGNETLPASSQNEFFVPTSYYYRPLGDGAMIAIFLACILGSLAIASSLTYWCFGTADADDNSQVLSVYQSYSPSPDITMRPSLSVSPGRRLSVVGIATPSRRSSISVTPSQPAFPAMSMVAPARRVVIRAP